MLTATLDAVGEYEPVPIENLIMDPKSEEFAAKMRKMKVTLPACMTQMFALSRLLALVALRLARKG